MKVEADSFSNKNILLIEKKLKQEAKKNWTNERKNEVSFQKFYYINSKLKFRLWTEKRKKKKLNHNRWLEAHEKRSRKRLFVIDCTSALYSF